MLESGDLEAAATKVSQLQRCQSVLSQTPDSEDRAALLNSFQLRIEAMASPHLVEAFTRRKLGELGYLLLAVRGNKEANAITFQLCLREFISQSN